MSASLIYPRFCADTVPGEGRILKCLENNEAKVSSRCKQAAKDVGLKRPKKALQKEGGKTGSSSTCKVTEYR